MAKREAKSRGPLLQLETLMRVISEDQFSAGWNYDLEFWLWEEIGKDCWDSTLEPVCIERRFQLARASALLGGWFHWDDAAHAPKFVPYAEWIVIYAAWKKGKK